MAVSKRNVTRRSILEGRGVTKRQTSVGRSWNGNLVVVIGTGVLTKIPRSGISLVHYIGVGPAMKDIEIKQVIHGNENTPANIDDRSEALGSRAEEAP